MSVTTRLISLALLLLLPGLATADNHKASNTFEESFTVNESIEFKVDTGSGSIEINAGPGRDVTVIGKVKVQNSGWFGRKPKNADELIQKVLDNPPIEISDGLVEVGDIKDRSVRKYVSVSYTITVPADSETYAKTGSGSIEINDIAARVEAGSGSGSVKLENIGGSVKASTGSGTIRAENVAGAFKANAGSGGIYLSQTAPGDVSVSTGSGGIELTGVVGALKARAGSGRITVDGRQEGKWDLGAGSGSIRVDLPDDAAFTVDAETNSGGIEIDHPLTVEGKISKRHVKGEVRGGGPLLRIDTGSGGIRVR